LCFKHVGLKKKAATRWIRMRSGVVLNSKMLDLKHLVNEHIAFKIH